MSLADTDVFRTADLRDTDVTYLAGDVLLFGRTGLSRYVLPRYRSAGIIVPVSRGDLFRCQRGARWRMSDAELEQWPDESHPRLLLFEAATYCDLRCLLTKGNTGGIRAVPPWVRVKQHQGPVWRMRLKGEAPGEFGTRILADSFLGLVGLEPDKPEAFLYDSIIGSFIDVMVYGKRRGSYLARPYPPADSPRRLVRWLQASGLYGAPELLEGGR